jgi:hypothetical protein
LILPITFCDCDKFAPWREAVGFSRFSPARDRVCAVWRQGHGSVTAKRDLNGGDTIDASLILIVKLQVKSAAQNRFRYTPFCSHRGIVIVGK